MIESKALHDVAPALAMVDNLEGALLTAAGDLQRLQALLDDSQRSLQNGFFGTLALLQDWHAAGRLDNEPLDQARQQLACAVKALQLQDMASQLIAHTQARLHNCAERYGHNDSAAGQTVGSTHRAPFTASPVAQCAMDTGRIDLF